MTLNSHSEIIIIIIKKDESPHMRIKQIQKCNSAHIKVGNPCNYRKCSQRKESKFSKQTSATKFSSSIVSTISSTDSCQCKQAIVVDDNSLNRLVLRRMLEKNNITVVDFSNGNDTINYFKRTIECKKCDKKGVRLIFTDVNMPNMNGFELSAQIRFIEKEGKQPIQVPIYGVTGGLTEKENTIAANCFNEVIIKPIDISMIRKILNNNLILH